MRICSDILWEFPIWISLEILSKFFAAIPTGIHLEISLKFSSEVCLTNPSVFNFFGNLQRKTYSEVLLKNHSRRNSCWQTIGGTHRNLEKLFRMSLWLNSPEGAPKGTFSKKKPWRNTSGRTLLKRFWKKHFRRNLEILNSEMSLELRPEKHVWKNAAVILCELLLEEQYCKSF